VKVELLLSAAAIFLSAFSVLHSLVLSIRRARAELMIRHLLDRLASRDAAFNEVVKEANTAFNDETGADSVRDVDAFRRAIGGLRGSLGTSETQILKEIADKSDRQMFRYSMRLAHSIAGRRTRMGRLIDKIIIRFLRWTGVRPDRHGERLRRP
jgi:hypothetical protein